MSDPYRRSAEPGSYVVVKCDEELLDVAGEPSDEPAAQGRVAAPGVERVAIVANSFAGAMMRAQQRNLVDTKGLECSFLVSGNLANIGIKNGEFFGWMRGANVPAVHPVSQYRCIFVYGRMPSPYGMADLEDRLKMKGFDHEAARGVLHDRIAKSDAYETRARLKVSTDIPIFLLSGNVPSNISGAQARYERGLNLIKNVLGETYHAFPDDLFTPDRIPRIDLYKNSLNKNGHHVAPELQERHDVHHMNELGGALILESIVKRAGSLTARPSV